MKKLWYPILVLVSMLVLASLYYGELLDDFQLKTGLLICTLFWFVGLAVMDFWGRREKSSED